jgi:glycosyltransferase involved in cell wall biosynthesis
MTGRPNPIIFYHPDGYRVARQDLKGRHSAGESFLTALLDQLPEPDVYALCAGKQVADDFVNSVRASHPARKPNAVSRADLETIRRQGLIYLPFPGIADEARLRNLVSDDAYAICGVTHTISSREVLDGVAELPVAPVKPWDALICTSISVHKALSAVLDNVEDNLRQRLGATKFTRPLMPVIPLGVHAGRFARKEADRASWRKKIGLADDVTAILFFGRLSVHAKAAPFQLALAAERAAQAGKARFAIIWCGWFNDDFQRRVFMNTAKAMAPSVPFHHVDGRDAGTRFSIWAAADIFCSLSDNIQESFGLTVIEAMAAGLPVVVSNWNGYREAVEHEVNGIAVDSYLAPGPHRDTAYRYLSGLDTYDLHIGALSQLSFVDLEQTAQWLVRLAGDKALRDKLAAAAQATIAQKFDWKAVMPRYFELWAQQLELLAKARRDGAASETAWRTHDPGFVFAGFPSHRLLPDTKLAAGPQYTRAADLAKQPGIVVNAAVLTGRSQFQALLALFADGQVRSVGETLAAFSEAERNAIVRTLHWAIKMGLLEIRKSA